MRTLILISLALFACTEKKSKEATYLEGSVLKTSKSFTIPKKLKERVEEQYVHYIHEVDPGNIASDDELTAQIPREFLEVDIYLRQLNPGTLSSDTVFRSPRGGGLIDLSDTVIGKKGSFFVSFAVKDPQNRDQELENLKVYYLSEVQAKEIGGKTYGSGCGTLVEISEAVKQTGSSNGLRVNAKDNRYFHTMAGTYLFVSYSLEKIYLAAIRVTDSSISGFECPGKS